MKVHRAALSLTLLSSAAVSAQQTTTAAAASSAFDVEAVLKRCNVTEIEELPCDRFQDLVASYGDLAPRALRCLKYDKFVSPAEHLDFIGMPFEKTVINASLQFSKLFEILHVDYFLSLGWAEPRFTFPQCVDPEEPFAFSYDFESEVGGRLFWIPPVELLGVVNTETQDGYYSGTTYRYFPVGYMSFMGRFTSRINCDMNFGLFPFDEQICHFNLTLSQGDAEKVGIEWDLEPGALTKEESIQLPDWDVELLTGNKFEHFVFDGPSSEGISCYFRLRRIYTVHLMQTFFPSIMITFSSVLSVFVPSDLVPGRMALCITSFLSVVSLFNGARKDWPRTSTLKAIDYWTAGCYITVFVALTEYCVVLYLTKSADWESKVRNGGKGGGASLALSKSQGDKRRMREHLAAQIERGARICFPFAWVAFNVLFWITCEMFHHH